MEQPEKEPAKSKKELAIERMKGKYPEANFENEEELFGKIYDDYDDYDKKLSEYAEREKTFSDMFSSDPRSAAFLMSWKNGDDPMIAFVRQFGTDIKEAIDDPERQEEIAAANKEFIERVAKEKELEQTYRQNLDTSLDYIDKMQKETGLSDEEVDKIMSFIGTIVSDGLVGKFSPETIEMARKALNHDVDVATAQHEGEVKGRNTKITERLRKPTNDGTAALAGKGAMTTRMPMRDMGAIDRFNENTQSIWERGAEKRRSYN